MMHGTRAHAMAMRELPEVRTVVPLLPELKLTPHFDAMLPKNATVSLNLMMAPLKRHEHLRQPSAALAEAYTQVLRARCEEDEAWRARPSCTRSPPLGVVAAGDDLLVAAQLSPDDAHAVAQLLAEQAEVHWVEPHPEYRVMNQPGAQIVQAGSTALDGTGTVVQQTPIWDMGIHGEEEIIGCGDSGLDTCAAPLLSCSHPPPPFHSTPHAAFDPAPSPRPRPSAPRRLDAPLRPTPSLHSPPLSTLSRNEIWSTGPGRYPICFIM